MTQKFLCDQMLGRVGRWLRAAGYDTAIAERSQTDSSLYQQAIEEDRILLTRDRQFAQIKSPKIEIIYDNGESTQRWVDILTKKLHLNWLHRPFSRCLLCNEILQEPPESSLKSVPEDARIEQKHLTYCPRCDKTYWEGSHTARMLKQLKTWNS